MTYLFSNASNATIINEVEVKNDSGNALPISKNTLPNSSANPINVALTSALDSGINSSIDSKGRLKVQTQESIFFNTFQNYKKKCLKKLQLALRIVPISMLHSSRMFHN